MKTPTKAATVTWRRDDAGRVQVLLITTKRGDRWILPMGTIEPGETPGMAAARETAEEAGAAVEIAEYLGTFAYHDLKNRPQHCAVYLARFAHEVKWLEADDRQRRWFTLDEASDQAAGHFKPYIAAARHHLKSA